MDRLVRSAQQLAGLLLVCAVVFGAARASVLGDHAWIPVLLALGVTGYLSFKAWQFVRKLLPRRNTRVVRAPQLPTRAHWMTPRTIQRRGRP
jgi:hypothetical protein